MAIAVPAARPDLAAGAGLRRGAARPVVGATARLPARLGLGHALLCASLGARGNRRRVQASGWNELLYRTWFLVGGVFTAAWLGLGTAFLLGKTRFGYAFACASSLAASLPSSRATPYNAGTIGVLVFIVALVFAIAIAVETYFQNERWPRIAALTVVVG